MDFELSIPEVETSIAKQADVESMMGSAFLPRLQLMSTKSGPVSEGKAKANVFYVVDGESLIEVGETVDVLVCSLRPKAIDYNGDEVVSVYNVDHPEFQRIQEGSGESDSGMQYGPEFLIWVPCCKKFASFFCGSKSARKGAPQLKERIGEGGKPGAATMGSKNATKGKYTWRVFTAVPCSTAFDLPDQKKFNDEYEKFMNPKEPEVNDSKEDSAR